MESVGYFQGVRTARTARGTRGAGNSRTARGTGRARASGGAYRVLSCIHSSGRWGKWILYFEAGSRNYACERGGSYKIPVC